MFGSKVDTANSAGSRVPPGTTPQLNSTAWHNPTLHAHVCVYQSVVQSRSVLVGPHPSVRAIYDVPVES